MWSEVVCVFEARRFLSWRDRVHGVETFDGSGNLVGFGHKVNLAALLVPFGRFGIILTRFSSILALFLVPICRNLRSWVRLGWEMASFPTPLLATIPNRV